MTAAYCVCSSTSPCGCFVEACCSPVMPSCGPPSPRLSDTAPPQPGPPSLPLHPTSSPRWALCTPTIMLWYWPFIGSQWIIQSQWKGKHFAAKGFSESCSVSCWAVQWVYLFLCPGRPGEADFWREPRSSVVGGHLSHSVWPARASWILTSDPPTGGEQKGQVM